MKDQALLKDIIIAYRKVIDDRYDYDEIVGQFDIPSSFDRAKFDALRSFFLTHIYPPPAQRAQLNAAFDSLENHIANPRYLLNVLMDSMGVIFRYGRHLPKILRVGLQAMQSFKKANAFEHQLAAAAKESDRQPPFSQIDIEHFTRQLSKTEVEAFIEDSLLLFDTLHDRKLVSKVIDIVNTIILKMEQRSHVYPESEVEGLRLGRDLVVEGNQLFESLTSTEQDVLFDMVGNIERGVLQTLFEADSNT